MGEWLISDISFAGLHLQRMLIVTAFLALWLLYIWMQRIN